MARGHAKCRKLFTWQKGDKLSKLERATWKNCNWNKIGILLQNAKEIDHNVNRELYFEEIKAVYHPSPCIGLFPRISAPAKAANQSVCPIHLSD